MRRCWEGRSEGPAGETVPGVRQQVRAPHVGVGVQVMSVAGAVVTEEEALLAAWREFLREGWIRSWRQEDAEVVYRAFCAAWVKGRDFERAD